ncbi:MAG TPA: Fur family transcriptional regulator [Acidimicrobiales bacterium]|nr:Fur family transcriptional regulator [Acidimicrobiales bacterium]
MTVSPAVHDQIARRLGVLDQRYTPLRRALVESMAGAGRPLTIPEILQSNPRLSQSSAYRNVTALIEAGAVRRITGADDHGRFELAEELSGPHHHHLVCGTCGKVADVRFPSRLERALHEAAQAAAREQHFATAEHRFDLVGVCADCRDSSGRPKRGQA